MFYVILAIVIGVIVFLLASWFLGKQFANSIKRKDKDDYDYYND